MTLLHCTLFILRCKPGVCRLCVFVITALAENFNAERTESVSDTAFPLRAL